MITPSQGPGASDTRPTHPGRGQPPADARREGCQRQDGFLPESAPHCPAVASDAGAVTACFLPRPPRLRAQAPWSPGNGSLTSWALEAPRGAPWPCSRLGLARLGPVGLSRGSGVCVLLGAPSPLTLVTGEKRGPSGHAVHSAREIRHVQSPPGHLHKTLERRPLRTAGTPRPSPSLSPSSRSAGTASHTVLCCVSCARRGARAGSAPQAGPAARSPPSLAPWLLTGRLPSRSPLGHLAGFPAPRRWGWQPAAPARL